MMKNKGAGAWKIRDTGLPLRGINPLWENKCVEPGTGDCRLHLWLPPLFEFELIQEKITNIHGYVHISEVSSTREKAVYCVEKSNYRASRPY